MENTNERIGKPFDMGYPHIFEGVDYAYPRGEEDYSLLMKRRIKGLGNSLMLRLKDHIKLLDPRKDLDYYPHIQEGMNGLTFHIGSGGRWIEAYDMIGSHFISGHNLDSYVDRAIAFNLGSDILEELDSGIKAPRIFKQGEGFVLRQYLPFGLKNIPEDNKYFNKESINRAVTLTKLKPLEEIYSQNGFQSFNFPQGVITVKDGIMECRDFKGWDFSPATWLTSRLMGLCNEE